MLARELNIVALDFETTGSADERQCIPWQIGAVCISRGRVVPGRRLSSYLRVPMDYRFNPYAPGRWADMREELAGCRSMQEEWPRFRPWLAGHCLMAHNVPTERKMLGQAYPMHIFGPWIDTLKMVRAAYPGLESHSLQAMLGHLGIASKVEEACPGLEPHDACYDAIGCAYVFECMLEQPEWHDVTLECLEAMK